MPYLDTQQAPPHTPVGPPGGRQQLVITIDGATAQPSHLQEVPLQAEHQEEPRSEEPYSEGGTGDIGSTVLAGRALTMWESRHHGNPAAHAAAAYGVDPHGTPQGPTASGWVTIAHGSQTQEGAPCRAAETRRRRRHRGIPGRYLLVSIWGAERTRRRHPAQGTLAKAPQGDTASIPRLGGAG